MSVKEWNDTFNPFNSFKGLLYANEYASIAKHKLPIPIHCSFDLTHNCQLRCSHCNAGRYIGGDRMTFTHAQELIRELSNWGVKSICFGGGGEPSLHSNLADCIELTRYYGMEVSVATNGIVLNKELMEAYKICTWIGISVDSATSSTYSKGRRLDKFNTVINNISKVSSVSNGVCYKFLIFDYNQHEIYDACKLAKRLGVHDFHARPADFNHQGLKNKKSNFFNIRKIQEQFEKCHQLENDNFHVYTVMHKFNNDFTPKRKFSQCFASPLAIQLCADGNIYHCFDTRHMEYYKLGSHVNADNLVNIWNSKKHMDLIYKNGCKNCESRCTLGAYNEQCERLFINNNDPMQRNFP